MSDALTTCGARIEAALEYLGHEVDPIRAITMAETQLRQALISLRASMQQRPERRIADTAPILTFLAASRVEPSKWPPSESRFKAVVVRRLSAEVAK